MKKNIPYGRQWIDDRDVNAVAKVVRSDWITQGPKVKEFEAALCAYTGAKYAVAVSSGTAALHIACLAAGIKERDEVITSPITFAASANSVAYCGGKPVFADIQPDTINIEPRDIAKKICNRTKAIMPVHFAGHPCDMKKIHDIARKHGLIVIEDAAHAMGAEYKDSKIGASKYSDMTIFSFHPVKSITTGEGGAVLTNRKDLYEKLLMLRSHGISKDDSHFAQRDPHSDGSWYYEMQHLGFNYRITDMQCALGISQIRKLDKFLKLRRRIAEFYNKELSGLGSIILPLERGYVKSAWHIYYIMLKDPGRRKDVFERLKRSGIGVQVHYIPVYLHPYYRSKSKEYRPGICPRAESYYSRAITLPLYPGMDRGQMKSVVQKVKKILGERQ